MMFRLLLVVAVSFLVSSSASAQVDGDMRLSVSLSEGVAGAKVSESGRRVVWKVADSERVHFTVEAYRDGKWTYLSGISPRPWIEVARYEGHVLGCAVGLVGHGTFVREVAVLPTGYSDEMLASCRFDQDSLHASSYEMGAQTFRRLFTDYEERYLFHYADRVRPIHPWLRDHILVGGTIDGEDASWPGRWSVESESLVDGITAVAFRSSSRSGVRLKSTACTNGRFLVSAVPINMWPTSVRLSLSVFGHEGQSETKYILTKGAVAIPCATYADE